MSLLKSLWTLIFSLGTVNFIIISFEENNERDLLEKSHVSSGLQGSMTKTSSCLSTIHTRILLCITFSLWILDVNGEYSSAAGAVVHFWPCSCPVLKGREQSVVPCSTWAGFVNGELFKQGVRAVRGCGGRWAVTSHVLAVMN